MQRMIREREAKQQAHEMEKKHHTAQYAESIYRFPVQAELKRQH